VLESGGAVVGDDDALAGGQPVVLDDVRRPELVEGGRCVLGAGAHQCPGGRDTGGRHHLLGERLGALEPSRLGRRAEGRDPARADRVGDAGDQGRLGPDDDQVHAEPLGKIGYRGAVHRIHGMTLGDRRHARVAGGGVDGGDGGVLCQRAGQGVLPASGADDQGGVGRAHRRRH
jgi:hypothetical protein